GAIPGVDLLQGDSQLDDMAAGDGLRPRREPPGAEGARYPARDVDLDVEALATGAHERLAFGGGEVVRHAVPVDEDAEIVVLPRLRLLPVRRLVEDGGGHVEVAVGEGHR